MADEKPPELNADWIEIKEYFFQEYLRNIRIFEFHIFKNTKSEFDFEGIGTFDILNEGIILISLVIRHGQNAPFMIYYLRLNDGSWVKGRLNTSYVCELNTDSLDEKEFLITLILSLETDTGVKKRIIVKKYKNPRD